MLKSISPTLIRMVALYGKEDGLARVSKAIAEVLPAVDAAVPADSPLRMAAYQKHPDDITSVDVRGDGIIDWVRSIPFATTIPEGSPSYVAASESIGIFYRVAATLRARTLLA